MTSSTALHLSILKKSLEKTKWENWTIQLCAIEASNRVYWRLINPANKSITVIAMVAPPHLEKTNSFIKISKLLESINLHPPHIHYQDEKAGLIILEDLGHNTYRQVISTNKQKLPALYTLFNSTIMHLHSCITKKPSCDLENYTEEVFWSEIENLFFSWYLPNIEISPLSPDAKKSFREVHALLIKEALEVPSSLCLRDAIVDNFMYRPTEKGLKKCAILDFQDALWGPITYDLASMYHDARFDLPCNITEKLLASYLKENPDLDKEKFMNSFFILSAQRNIKVLGTFSRLAYRDGKTKYLQYIPLAWRFLEKCLSHPKLKPLKTWMDLHLPTTKRKLPTKPYAKKKTIHQAMIMCAGFGKRLTPITEKCPKPLIPIADTTALGWLIEKLRAQGIEKIVINTHHLAQQVKDYIDNYDHGNIQFIFSNEQPIILDTGGGIYKALPHFENKPFLAINCDMLWSGNEDPLSSLCELYNPQMPLFLGLTDPDSLVDYHGPGDYFFLDKKPYRMKNQPHTQKKGYVFTGIRIIHPNIFKNVTKKTTPFSLLEIFDWAEKNNQLSTHIYSDKITWWDLGTLEKLKKTQDFFTSYFEENNE